MESIACPQQAMSPAKRRLLQDLKKLQDDPPYGICVAPKPDDIFVWTGLIVGPSNTPFENGIFKVKLVFSLYYPQLGPSVMFTSRMFHPNVSSVEGSVCLSILTKEWSPHMDVAAVLVSVQALLGDPNPDSPINIRAATMYRGNHRLYLKTVAEIVKQSLEDADGGNENETSLAKEPTTHEAQQDENFEDEAE